MDTDHAEVTEELSAAAAERRARLLRNACVDLLGRREHSREELRRKLSTRFGSDQTRVEVSAEEIEAAIEYVVSLGLQSDQRFCESYARQRFDRGDGPLKIRAALRQRGVASTMIANVLESPDFDWTEKARDIYQRKYSAPGNSGTGEALMLQKAKAMRFLRGRGFFSDHIYAAVE